jgi:hypothetical protein
MLLAALAALAALVLPALLMEALAELQVLAKAFFRN